jgi:hypothetical protein
VIKRRPFVKMLHKQPPFELRVRYKFNILVENKERRSSEMFKYSTVVDQIEYSLLYIRSRKATILSPGNQRLGISDEI